MWLITQCTVVSKDLGFDSPQMIKGQTILKSGYIVLSQFAMKQGYSKQDFYNWER